MPLRGTVSSELGISLACKQDSPVGRPSQAVLSTSGGFVASLLKGLLRDLLLLAAAAILLSICREVSKFLVNHSQRVILGADDRG